MIIENKIISFCEKKKKRENEMLFDVWDDGAATEGFPYPDYTEFKTEVKVKELTWPTN